MSRSAPNPMAPRRALAPPAGAVGAPDIDVRGVLLEKAGVTEEVQAQAVAKAFAKKVELLEAKTTKFFSHEGEVLDQRELTDNDTQLKAAEAIDRMVGVMAPPATRKVTVVHKLEWPEWYRAADQPAVVTIESEVAE